MSFVVLLSCAHAAVILSGEDVREIPPPHDRPWILFPLPDGDSIDPGDGMSCITCMTPQTVACIYATDKVQFTSDGRLRLP
jgi:hypothetical protein